MMKKIFLICLVLVFSVFNSSQGYCDDVDRHIYLGSEFLNGDLLRVSVFAENFEQPILGIAFHLIYEAENVAFLRYDPGQFLERGGDPFYLVQNVEPSEKIIFGSTLRRNDDFPLGGDKIVDFYFQILEEGAFNFSFERGVVSTLDVVRQDLDEIFWENSVFERGDTDQVVFSSKANSSVLSIEASDKNTFLIPFFVIATAVLSAFLIIYFLKKQEKKRPDSSVNFK